LLGEGGMGQVYRAHDGALDETVALKFIHPHLAERRESLDLFKREVKLARAVTHPNVCRIHEFLHMEGRDFLSMEYIAGRSLEGRIRADGPLSPDETLAIARQLCAGLAAAHRRGVIHQDLKPANVLVEEGTGRAVITDFGIARLAEAEPRGSERAARVAGTPEYMAPEQAQGFPPGPAADLYSLGIILFEMLAGQPPFTAPSAGEVLMQQVTRPAPDLAALRPDVPPALRDAVRACLEKDPRRRPRNAEELLRRLGGEKPKSRARPWLALAGVLAALAIVLFAILPGPRPPGGERRLAPLFSTGALERAPRVRPDGKAVAFLRDGAIWTTVFPSPSPVRLFSPDAQAPIASLTWSGPDLLAVSTGIGALRLDPEGRAEPLAGVPVACPLHVSPDGRRYCGCRLNSSGNADLVAGEIGGAERVLLEASEGRSFDRPRFSPDGRRIALVVAQGGFRTARDIGVIPAAGGELLLLTRDGIPQRLNNTDPAWSPDGRWIVYSSRRSGTQALWCVPADGGESFPLSPGATAGQYAPDPWPEGGALAFEVREERQDLTVADLAGGGLAHLGDERASNRFPVFSPDGRYLAYRTLRGEDNEDEGAAEIVVADSERDGEKRFPAPAGTRELCWCGSTRILFARTEGQDRQLMELTLPAGTMRTLARGFSGLWSPHADPQCRRVVFSAQKKDEAGRRLYEIRMPDGEPVPLTPAGETAVFPALSPDGQRVAFRRLPDADGAGTATLRLLEPGQRAARLVTAHGSFARSQRRLRWTSDGKALFYLEPDGAGARLWRVPAAGGAPREARRLPEISTFDFDLTADGARLVYPVTRTSADIFRMEGIEW
jgi:Tol biopolymer transport system component